jgi:hypothetical protein
VQGLGLQIVKVASLSGGVVSQMAAAADASASLPSETLRCAGPAVMVGLRKVRLGFQARRLRVSA